MMKHQNKMAIQKLKGCNKQEQRLLQTSFSQVFCTDMSKVPQHACFKGYNRGHQGSASATKRLAGPLWPYPRDGPFSMWLGSTWHGKAGNVTVNQLATI